MKYDFNNTFETKDVKIYKKYRIYFEFIELHKSNKRTKIKQNF